MGATFTVIAARGTQQPGEIAQLDRIDGGDDWSLFRPVDRFAYPSTIRDLTLEAATSVGGVALAGFVADSDYGYLLAATSEGTQVWLLIDPDAADEFAEGSEPSAVITTDWGRARTLRAMVPGDPEASRRRCSSTSA